MFACSGPLLGAYLSYVDDSFFLAAMSSGLLFAVASLLLQLVVKVPKTNNSRKELKETVNAPSSCLSSFGNMAKCMFLPSVWRVLVLKFCYSFAEIQFNNVEGLIYQKQFQMSPPTYSWVSSVDNLFGFLCQAFIITFCLKYFTEKSFVLISAALGCFTFCLILWINSVEWLVIAILPLKALSFGALQACLISLFTQAIPSSQTTTFLALANILDSVARIFGPTVGGFLVDCFGASGPSLLSSCLLALVFVLGNAFNDKIKPADSVADGTILDEEADRLIPDPEHSSDLAVPPLHIHVADELKQKESKTNPFEEDKIILEAQ
eukprot:TRINITY_DN2052_c0_g1_i2.p1 TRINITY_DN2052_c0_g1~~TRINITY_DN2052_c0_g1_i2.p1  ORF type:complete len:322 (+),score=67.09 TRINITY_DN2052_c0_g1_i2:480-1445(+)